jgi:hypothetical protein
VTALIVGLTVAVGLLGVLVAGLLRGHAEVLRALHQMGVDLDPSTDGSPAPGAAGPVPVSAPEARGDRRGGPGGRPTPGRPDATDLMDLSGVTPSGDAVSLAVTGVRHDTLIAFLTSGCATCRGFWDAFRSGRPDVPGGARLVAVTRGPEAESPAAVGGLAGNLPVVMSTALWEHYDIPYAPYFVYVSGPAAKVMGEGVAAGWEEVKALVANAVADGTTSPAGAEPAGASPAGAAPGAAPDDQQRLAERSRADRERDDLVDRQLRAAGIEPGDPRLYPTSISDAGGHRNSDARGHRNDDVAGNSDARSHRIDDVAGNRGAHRNGAVGGAERHPS